MTKNDPKPSSVTLFGLPIRRSTFGEAAEAILALSQDRVGAYVLTPNVDHVVKLHHDESFRSVYREATYIVADGMPLVWLSRLCGNPLPERVTGADLFVDLCRQAADRGLRVYLLGSASQAIIERTAEALKRRFPRLEIVGARSPSFGFEKNEGESKALVEEVRAANPDLLFVGVGAPKQEKWIYRYRHQLNAGVALGVGAAFDFVAGKVDRAPAWMQTLGLEWLFRISQEPKRMVRRYLVEDLIFFRLALREWSRSKVLGPRTGGRPSLPS